jgi:catechol 2,3-dioxygenase-like lactoylglutathione lyase family enzyme
MLDHIGVSVSDYEKSKAFYEKALAPLGYSFLMEVPREYTGGAGVGGFGIAPKPDFWIEGRGGVAAKLHVCFRAADRATVDAFYKAAMAAGGRDNGKPGLRPEYHANYYGAFVLDPDGYNVEAVCHDPA